MRTSKNDGLFCLAILAFALASPVSAQTGEAAALFPIAKDGKWGYIDKTGKLVIPLKLTKADAFSEGLAAVEMPLDQRSQSCVRPDAAGSSYTASKKYGYIDKIGKMSIPPLFESAGPFVEGLANVSNCYKASFIGRTGEVVISTQFQYASPFSGGLAAVGVVDGGGLRKGYINRAGKVIWEPTN